MADAGFWAVFIVFGVLAIAAFGIILVATRYKRCASDEILVVYGRIRGGKASRCIHGGAVMVWPLIQEYKKISLIPMTISIPLDNALSLQNIRINVPSTFTVGVSTNPLIMNNAAERLLHLTKNDIEGMAQEIILGQLRLTVASLTIEQINQDRDAFLELIRDNVGAELHKLGLYLINVNIIDITDESNYINSIGKKAAAGAVNKALVDVANAERDGAIGKANADREREVQVAQNVAESEKGQKAAEVDRRVYVQQQEATGVQGENISRAEIAAYQADLEEKEAEAMRRAEVARRTAEMEVQKAQYNLEQERLRAEEIVREEISKTQIEIAAYQADLEEKEAEAMRRAEVARRTAEMEVQKAQYNLEQERLRAEEIVREEISKTQIEIAAEAEAERQRRIAQGEADAVLARYNAEAEGTKAVLEAKANGYKQLVASAGGDVKAAATLLMVEKIEEIVARQTEAIANLQIDKITVWDSGNGGEGGSTANFVSSLIRSLPPVHDVAKMAGVDLPDYLGSMKEE